MKLRGLAEDKKTRRYYDVRESVCLQTDWKEK